MSSSWTEKLAFAPLEIAERGEEIGRRLRQAIELGVLEDGTQLPSESELAAMMGVSTQTLRTALAELRHLGLVETRRGRGGGSFVKANMGDIARARRETLAGYSLDELRDLREYRAVLAGSAAAAAAARSEQISVARLVSLAAMVEGAQGPAEMTRADSGFHMELAAASRSVRLSRQEMALLAEVGPLVWSSASDRGRQAATEHAAIVEAILAGDVARARARAEQHVRGDINRLIDLRMSMDTAAPGAPPAGAGLEYVIASIEALASKIQNTAASSIRVVEDAVHAALAAAPTAGLEELEAVYDVARRTLGEVSPTLYGLGIMADASFFGEPRLIWSYTPVGQHTQQRLHMDLEFYDYTSTPWWPQGGTQDAIRPTYAYADGNGSNAYIITFSKPVTQQGGLVGVALADVLIGQLQASFEPLLLSLPPGSCIVDQKNVVIATNTGSLIGETFKPTGDAGSTTALPAVPWQLHLGRQAEPQK
ncbi:GntR family transcriptional regulator [Sinomonas sp. G460-2]|uniref:GntR family transcriptional regulator n=1 Tax=Sinomonas sp. G460-2 TaxID=3393464 RepID=UPI0039EDF20A